MIVATAEDLEALLPNCEREIVKQERFVDEFSNVLIEVPDAASKYRVLKDYGIQFPKYIVSAFESQHDYEPEKDIEWLYHNIALIAAGKEPKDWEYSKVLCFAAVRTGQVQIVLHILQKFENMLTQLLEPDDEGLSALHIAVRNRDTKMVQLLLKLGANPNQTSTKNPALILSPVHIAGFAGGLEVVKLFDQKHLLVEDEQYHRSSLFFAVQSNSVDVVDYILSEGIENVDNVVFPGFSFTPIHLAAMKGAKETAQLLVEKFNVDVDLILPNGVTPLHYAVFVNNVDMVRFMVEELGATSNICDDQGWSVMHFAAEKNYHHIIKYLLSIDAQHSPRSSTGETPLRLAIHNNHFRTIELLLHAGADTSKVDNHGRTDLHHCVMAGSVEIVELVLSSSLDRFNHTDEFGWTPLHYAAERNDPDIIRLLVLHGCDVHVHDTEGRSPLQIAVLLEREFSWRTLLILGAKPDHKDHHGVTALHMAAGRKRADILSELVESNTQPDVDIADDRGRTPLHVAGYSGSVVCVKVLVNHGAETCAVDKNGCTPIHAAVEGSQLLVLEELIASGVPLNTLNNDGHLAIHYAPPHSDLFQYLETVSQPAEGYSAQVDDILIDENEGSQQSPEPQNIKEHYDYTVKPPKQVTPKAPSSPVSESELFVLRTPLM
eukprot:TRINITY_DN29234_c0_g1_i1.p1 TRINITY_DN29234_c0_g1~~TRINITY_DN29234_c0_g1_i1.p1  ORF type:complete len:661 (-),score=63.76 TRINITY_DN29234_c0_g1_i1:15-1997(-)